MKDKNENSNKVSDKTQNAQSIMDMILNMNPGQTSNSEQHAKGVPRAPLDNGTVLKG